MMSASATQGGHKNNRTDTKPVKPMITIRAAVQQPMRPTVAAGESGTKDVVASVYRQSLLERLRRVLSPLSRRSANE